MFNGGVQCFLGIDPGLAGTGYGVILQDKSKLSLLNYGCIKTSKEQPFEDRLDCIYRGIVGILEKYKPDFCSLEELFFAKNVKSALKVGEARGVVILAAKHKNLKIYEYTPLQIKEALTSYGRADKGQIQTMVKILLRMKEIPEPDHAADALAAAICCANDSFKKL